MCHCACVMTTSAWGALEADSLLDIFNAASFESKLACDCVCRGWRSVLSSQPVTHIWIKTLVLLDANVLTRIHNEGQAPIVELSIS